jgi:nitrite reductase/ring-hydroxylating ferredoxin subunit
VTEVGASRRNVIAGLAAAGAAVPLIAACGSGGGSTVTGTTGSSTGAPTPVPTPKGGGGGGIPTAEIPVGGGRIFPGQNLVVTQPRAGEFKAFSATCTHQGCMVGGIAQGAIICPCHGSGFSIEDGSVEGGPAPSPLPEKKVTVTGSTLQVT